MSTKNFCPFLSLFLGLVISFAGSGSALAAPGDLDTTFDGDGLVITNIVPSIPGRSDKASGIAIQADGKIVVAGDSGAFPAFQDFTLARYNTDGALDTTFHTDGRLVTNFGSGDEASDVAVQSDNKIVAAGQTCINYVCDVAVARYNSSGVLDTTFSGDGKQTTDFGGSDNGLYGGLAIQSNGKIVVAGYVLNGTDYDFAVYRYLSNGSLDTTFSGDGKVSFGFGAGRQDSARDLVLQNDGKIVVAGDSGGNFAIARLNLNGSIDTTFSGDGKQTTDIGPNGSAWGVALQPDGKIVVVGQIRPDEVLSFRTKSAIARYNTNGSLDTNFNVTGKKVFSVIPSAYSGATDVIIESNGKIVVLAFTPGDFALVRLKSGGAFDTTFSGDGKTTFDFGGSELAATLAVQPLDGKYVLAGYTNSIMHRNDFALARVLP